MNILKRMLPKRVSEPASQPVRPAPESTGAVQKDEAEAVPRAAEGLNNYIMVVLDSCRYDSLMAAAPPTLSRLGAIERRWSYASWTAPSHYNLLMGLLPHSSPPHVYASEYYKRDFLKYQERLGAEQVEFKSLVPHLFLPTFLKRKLGYQTHARVSLPVLNPATLLNKDFDSFQLMPKHNDMAAMIERLTFSPERPSFYLLNVGETHYPYALPDEPEDGWPKIHGVHGVFKHLDDFVVGGKLVEDEEEPEKFFDQEKLDLLRARQVSAVKYLDGVFARLFDVVPPNTYITVTGDHGELFGEAGYFGHGPITHDKVYEVPFIEGKIR
ncbi:MAG: sulfatase-like hydrolase/transferase [Candidatus Binatia bacterium]